MLLKNVASEPRLCTNCRVRKPTKNGGYNLIENGMRQRWVCGDCKPKMELKGEFNGT